MSEYMIRWYEIFLWSMAAFAVAMIVGFIWSCRKR